MNTLSQIVDLFRNPATRQHAVILGITDLSFIVAIIVSLILRAWFAAALLAVVYAIIYFVARYFINIYGAFTNTEDFNDEL